MNKPVQKSPFLLRASIAVMLVQSFVVSTVIKGLVPSYIFILLLFFKDLTLNITKERILRILFNLLKFAVIFIAVQIVIQFINSLTTPNFSGLITISNEPSHVSVFRQSLFTQSIYLMVSVLFFLYVLNYLKVENNSDKLIKIARIGIILFVLYGFYEIIGYQLTGDNVDFISNRIAGEDYNVGHFQRLPIGDFMVQRMKSLSAEPSTFAFSIVPFMVLFYYRKDKTYLLLLLTLFLSTATTGFLGLILFILIELIFIRKSQKLVMVLSGIFAMGLIIFYDIVISLYDYTVSKLALADISSIDRFAKFTSHFDFFINSDLFHILLGYGFGYMHSPDGLSTLLVNTGLIGTCAFTMFFLYPVFKIPRNTDYRIGLFSALIISVILVLISVSEFYYIHMWFLGALAWHEYGKEQAVINVDS